MENKTQNTIWNALKFTTIIIAIIFVFGMVGGIATFYLLANSDVDYTFFFIVIVFFLRAIDFSIFAYLGMLIAWKLGIWKVNEEMELSIKNS